MIGMPWYLLRRGGVISQLHLKKATKRIFLGALFWCLFYEALLAQTIGENYSKCTTNSQLQENGHNAGSPVVVSRTMSRKYSCEETHRDMTTCRQRGSVKTRRHDRQHADRGEVSLQHSVWLKALWCSNNIPKTHPRKKTTTNNNKTKKKPPTNKNINYMSRFQQQSDVGLTIFFKESITTAIWARPLCCGGYPLWLWNTGARSFILQPELLDRCQEPLLITTSWLTQ